MQHSLFAVEVCLPVVPELRESLRARIAQHPECPGYQEKWELYRGLVGDLLPFFERVERGTWDYFVDDARARAEYDDWSAGLLAAAGARPKEEPPPDPFRDGPGYMCAAFVFLLKRGSFSDRAIAEVCNVGPEQYWLKSTFARLLQGIGAMSFATVRSDLVYVVPGSSDAHGLSAADLASERFSYLKPIA